MKEFTMRARTVILALAALALAASTVSAQTPATPAPAPAPALKKMAPPLRGPIEVGYMMAAKRDGDKIVTTFQVKNLSLTGSIIGLQIEQYFYDKAGNPIQGTGDRQRLKTPLGPDEVATITLTSATVPGMTSPQHKFTYRDGEVKPKAMKTLK
jgi:hypothetical protein